MTTNNGVLTFSMDSPNKHMHIPQLKIEECNKTNKKTLIT